jgi:2-polyprenyl-3-methyl-5-hydroxy-6-metoxy-1,4-benzoquinol methylase
MGSCPLCGSDTSRVVCDCSNVPPRINSLAGMVQQCAVCRFLFKEPTLKSLDSLEEIYQYTVEDTEFYFGPTMKGYDLNSAEIRFNSSILEEIRRWTSSTSDSQRSLLDVGCATGALLDQSRAFGFVPHGVELNPHFAEYARTAFGLPVVAGELSLDHFDPEAFDVITMIDLLEHVADPLGLLDAAWHLLKPGGLLVVYTPNHRSVIAWLSLALYRLSGRNLCTPAYIVFGTNHVCFFDHKTLPMAFERTGFDVEAMHRVRYEPAREGEVGGQSGLAFGLRALEIFAQTIGLPYRLLAFARKPDRFAGCQINNEN